MNGLLPPKPRVIEASKIMEIMVYKKHASMRQKGRERKREREKGRETKFSVVMECQIVKEKKMSKLFIGVDLGGTKIYTALSDERGNILKEIIKPTEASNGYEQIVEKIKESIRYVRIS